MTWKWKYDMSDVRRKSTIQWITWQLSLAWLDYLLTLSVRFVIPEVIQCEFFKMLIWNNILAPGGSMPPRVTDRHTVYEDSGSLV